tara:strand:+ start:1226 stop:2041 length:816 start_codon:yes stop_codon:yes gene_type:complete
MPNGNQPNVAQTQNNPKWEVVATPMLKEVGTFLQSRKQSFTTSFNLDASQGVPMTNEPVTYTAAQVVAFAVDVLELCAERTDCKDMGEPSKMGRKALGKAFVAESVYSNVSKLIVVKQLNAFRRTLKSARKAQRVAEAVAEGRQWYADGVVFDEKHELAGQPKPFPSRRKAVSGYLQMTVGMDWSKKANKGELKDMALSHVRQGAVDAPTAQETRDAQATPAPVASQSTVSAKVTKAELVTQAVALGIAKSRANGMKKADLVATINALSNL